MIFNYNEMKTYYNSLENRRFRHYNDKLKPKFISYSYSILYNTYLKLYFNNYNMIIL